MTGNQVHIDRIRQLLQRQRFAVLSTRQQCGQPYASLVSFWGNAELTQIVFCTLRATRKYANLVRDGRVALLVDDRSNEQTDLQEAAAVTVLGACQEAQGAERALLAERFLSRHPAMAEFVRSPGCAVMRVDIQTHYLVTHFQNVVELHLKDGLIHGAD